MSRNPVGSSGSPSGRFARDSQVDAGLVETISVRLGAVRFDGHLSFRGPRALTRRCAQQIPSRSRFHALNMNGLGLPVITARDLHLLTGQFLRLILVV